MLVKELVEALQKCDQNQKVYIEIHHAGCCFVVTPQTLQTKSSGEYIIGRDE